MPEPTQAVLRRYLAIPAGRERLKVLETNLSVLVGELTKEEPGEVNIHLPLPAVLLDLVREIRALRGESSGEDSTPPAGDGSESPPPIRVEQIEMEGNLR